MAKRYRISKGDQWVDELISTLDEFVDEECDTINEVFKDTANETKDMVAAKSPERTGAYASGWEVVEKNKGGFAGNTVSYTVANTQHYQLTHLLEKGHAVRNQYGGPDRPGAKKRVSARRHIKPAEIWGNQLLLAKLRSKL